MTPTAEQRIQALEDRVQALEEALGLTATFPLVDGLTPQQNRMLGILCKAGLVPRERFMAALYGDSLDPPLSRSIDVQLSKMRKLLRPLGVEIRSHWGTGWWIEPEHKRRLLDA